MALKMNLWSLTLIPGEKYPMYIRRPFQLTNVALGDELASKDGRSVIKVTHQPLPPPIDDSDSEFDSDIDIDDAEVDEDEFELDTEEGFKLTPKKGKAAANGAAEESEDDAEVAEGEDDESDDEDDDDFSDDEEVEETNVICALTAGKIEQASVNLTFVSGDAVMFEATGDNVVHLLGNYIYQAELDDSDDEDDSDFDDEHDDYSELYGSDEEEDVPAGKITEIAEPKKAAKAVASKPAAAAVDNKKRKAEAIESPAPKASAAESADELSKAQKKKLAKKAKRESTGAESAAAAPAQEKKAEPKKDQKQQKKTLPNGLVIEVVKEGTGPAAKNGQRLGMRYIGKLENGKQFDANTSGKPFSFMLGRGEVIKGWDMGLSQGNARIGSEIRLTLPPALAYGSQKLPGIPKNSTLNFDVKVVTIG